MQLYNKSDCTCVHLKLKDWYLFGGLACKTSVVHNMKKLEKKLRHTFTDVQLVERKKHLCGTSVLAAWGLTGSCLQSARMSVIHPLIEGEMSSCNTMLWRSRIIKEGCVQQMGSWQRNKGRELLALGWPEKLLKEQVYKGPNSEMKECPACANKW